MLLLATTENDRKNKRVRCCFIALQTARIMMTKETTHDTFLGKSTLSVQSLLKYDSPARIDKVSNCLFSQGVSVADQPYGTH